MELLLTKFTLPRRASPYFFVSSVMRFLHTSTSSSHFSYVSFFSCIVPLISLEFLFCTSKNTFNNHIPQICINYWYFPKTILGIGNNSKKT